MIQKRDKYCDIIDENLVQLINEGNRNALTSLVNRYKDFIYNVAVRMTGNTYDAEDITQEILIKVVTKLSTFKFKSSFKTWLYRIVVNHCLNTKKHVKEKVFQSFESHHLIIENLEDEILKDDYDADNEILNEEIKVECMLGTLLCLNREQRIIFILSGIFNVDSKTGGKIFEISEENYRKKLSRARSDLRNYMNGQCSLVNGKNNCRCSKKTKAAIEAGYVNPDKLQFFNEHYNSVKEIVYKNLSAVDNILELKSDELFREHPYLLFENDLLKRVLNY